MLKLLNTFNFNPTQKHDNS